jgi:hypothetical protein
VNALKELLEAVPTGAVLVHNPLASLGIDDRFRPVWLTTRRHALHAAALDASRIDSG